MLCRKTIVRHIAQHAPEWSARQAAARERALQNLRFLMQDSARQEQVRAQRQEQGLLAWHGAFMQAYPLEPSSVPYVVTGIDGSHIAADYHAGFDCCVVHIGSCTMRYGTVTSSVQYNGLTSMYDGNHMVQADEEVRQLRTLAEFQAVAPLWHEQHQTLLLLDGTLPPVVSVNPALQEVYAIWAAEDIPVASYVSAPRSTLLSSLIADNNEQHTEDGRGTNITDADLFFSLLPAGHYSGPWVSATEFFIYVHTGLECARVELPLYLKDKRECWESLLRIVKDQVDKGAGYPLCLAEAHVQAVITEQDRQFVIAQWTMHCNILQNQGSTTSRSSMKLARKRSIPI